MLFNDPYKNIHGYTVSMPDDSSPIDPLGRKVKVNNTRPARTNQSNNGGAAVGVLLFFMLIFIVPIIFTALVEEMDIRNKSGDIGYDDGTNKLLDIIHNIKSSYTFDEIAKGFGLSDFNIKFTPTDEFQPLSVVQGDVLALRQKNHSLNFIEVIITDNYSKNVDLIEDDCAEDTENHCSVVDDFSGIDGKYVLTHKADSVYDLYYTIGVNLIDIHLEPYEEDSQSQDAAFNILRGVYGTLSKNEDTPGVFQMAAHLEMPLNKKVPLDSDITFISFDQNYIHFTTKVANSILDQYDFTVYHRSHRSYFTKADYAENGIKIYAHNDEQRAEYIVQEVGNTTRDYIFEVRYLSASDGDRPLADVDEFLDAYETLSTKL